MYCIKVVFIGFVFINLGFTTATKNIVHSTECGIFEV